MSTIAYQPLLYVYKYRDLGLSVTLQVALLNTFSAASCRCRQRCEVSRIIWCCCHCCCSQYLSTSKVRLAIAEREL